MAKEWDTGFADIDYYDVIRKDNRRLITVMLVSMILNLLLGVLLIANRTPQIKILRLYDNVENNSTIDNSSLTQSINQRDLLLFSQYIIEHYDLKSSNALFNYKKLLAVADAPLQAALQKSLDKIMVQQSSSGIDKIYNEIIDTTPPEIKSSPQYITVKVRYSQFSLLKDGSENEQTKETTLVFKKVNRMRYEHKKEIGGWYYGLLLNEISDPVDHI